MVKTGSFKLKNAPLSGRIGSGIGQGLAEQLPKEMQQGRLQAGLQQFAKESPNMTPLQAAANLFGIPGVTPQMVQILPELLKQQQLASSLGQEQQPPPFPSLGGQEQGQPTTGLTTRPGLEATRKGYIPPSVQEIDARAAQLYNQNPGRFKNNPENAIQYARDEAAQEQSINQAYQLQRQGEQNIQKNVQSNLQTQASLLGAKVPGEVYSDIEQRAIRSVLPVEEGGEGLTDDEAKIKYGKELDEVSRDYDSLNRIGSLASSFENPKDDLRKLNNLREKFKERKDLENLAQSFISKQKLSPTKAYTLTYPIEELPDLNKFISKLPNISSKVSFESGKFEKKEPIVDPKIATRMISEKLAEKMGKEGSPLSIAEELDAKGYDSNEWLNYVTENAKKLDLTGRQSRELDQSRNVIPTLSDIWLFKLVGKDKFVE